jgi:hypothetical protein
MGPYELRGRVTPLEQRGPADHNSFAKTGRQEDREQWSERNRRG